MPATHAGRQIEMAQPDNSVDSQIDWIGCLTYRSVATTRPSPSDLETLVSRARARNRSLGITGMLLFEDGQYFQTLEGPPDALETIWSSVERDPRHRNIEVLSQHLVPARLFSDWDLLLCNRRGEAPGSGRGSAAAPAALDDYLRRVVQLALDADDLRLDALIGSLAQGGWTNDAIVMLLIEPAARALGDAWLADECSELDLTIALSMLQLAGHAARHHAASTPMPRGARYTVLLATAPGEPHMLGTTLLADQFTDEGWEVTMAFPDSEEALLNQVRAQHPDAVDIGLSDAMPRGNTVSRLRSAIAHTRAVAANYPTVISVGGRLFAEAAATAASVGADHARRTAAGSSIRIAALVRSRRAE
jgi:methanogenic corrinoid protein MtbC1